jgi:hypothetical protein
MVSPSKVIREFRKAGSRSSRNTKKALEDKSYIDVEAREVKPKPAIADKTMRADKRDMSKPKGRSGRAAAIAAGATATAAGVAALSGGKDDKKQPASPRAVGASSKTESKKEIQAKSATSSAKKGLSDFEKKFKEMRAAGRDTFTWNGKKITTRYKEETDAQHKANIAKIKSKNESAYEKKMKEVSKMRSGGMAKKK